MNSLDSIVQLNKIVSSDFCNEIIDYSNKYINKQFTVEDEVLDLNFRNVMGYHLNLNLDKKEIKNLYEKIETKIINLYQYYKIKFPKIDEYSKVTQIDLLKYEKGGKYLFHVDQTTFRRQVSVIINLNNEYEGGDLVFGDQKDFEVKRCKLDTGSVVFFPSNFMYPHGIEPITKGTRYSIVSWLC
tara:strand:+ start:58 stop:612 length:555 start_codon:yes stop_codon:yes gene_type:complete